MGKEHFGPAENFAVRPTVGGVGVALLTELGGGGDLAMSTLAPSEDVTLSAGKSAVVVRSFKIASTKKLIIGSGSRFRIL